ncbi:MAG: BatA and WFA domain-containing protein [Lachnospiraceae bacterium]|nr:BatA and WFA domain-containing protein [Lachnospiraceae bacterium]
MGFHSLWPLALLVLVPVIILLYILKQEAKQHFFSSTMLWQEVYRNLEAAKPWEKLKKNILLFLQIVTVLLFIAALMGPWLKSFGSEKQQVILVLDNSASMGTLYEKSETRLEAAKEAACRYVDSLPSGSVVHVISSDRQAVLVLSSSSDKTEAKNRIRGIRQTNLAGDLSAALGLVQSCASQSEQPEICFFTDTVFDMGDLHASVASFYSELPNLSVDTVSCGEKDHKPLVLVRVTNHSKQTQNAEINLYGEAEDGKEKLLDIASEKIPAGESKAVYFELDEESKTDAIGEIKALCAELNEQDALKGDNKAWCVLDERKVNRVLLLTKSNLFVEKAFANLPGVELYRSADVKVIEKESGAKYDLYIFDGIVPERLPSSGSFFFINCDHADLFEKMGSVRKKFLTLTESEVTTYIADRRIGVNKADTYRVPGWGTAFLKSGNESAGFYGAYDGHQIAVLGFDLHQTDFGLQAEFPVLMSGLADYLLANGLTDRTFYTAGDSIMLRANTKGSELTLVMPDGSRRQIKAAEAAGSYLEAADTGIYQVSQELNGEVKQQKFAVGFPSALESSVESAQSMTADGENEAGRVPQAGSLEIRNVILLFLILLIMAEWVVYLRIQ